MKIINDWSKLRIIIAEFLKNMHLRNKKKSIYISIAGFENLGEVNRLIENGSKLSLSKSHIIDIAISRLLIDINGIDFKTRSNLAMIDISGIKTSMENIPFHLTQESYDLFKRVENRKRKKREYRARIEAQKEASRIINDPLQEPISRPEIIEDEDYSHELEPELDN